jgi:hypothetical protein
MCVCFFIELYSSFFTPYGEMSRERGNSRELDKGLTPGTLNKVEPRGGAMKTFLMPYHHGKHIKIKALRWDDKLNNFASTVRTWFLHQRAKESRTAKMAPMFWPFLIQASFKGSLKAIFLSSFSLNIDFQTTVREAIGKSFKSVTKIILA